MKSSLKYLLALVLVAAGSLVVIPSFAGDSGLTGATIAVDQFSPSGGLDFKADVLDSLTSLDTAVDAVITDLDTRSGVLASASAAAVATSEDFRLHAHLFAIALAGLGDIGIDAQAQG